MACILSLLILGLILIDDAESVNRLVLVGGNLTLDVLDDVRLGVMVMVVLIEQCKYRNNVWHYQMFFN